MSGFDYFTIIGRDPSLWRWHVQNILRNAGLDRAMWTFNVIVYRNEKIDSDITDEILEINKKNDIVSHLHYENPNDSFLKRLYACWNKLYELGDRKLVLRGGSDQAWSRNSFAIMLDEYQSCAFNPLILQAQTIEAFGPSRHILKDFGDTPETFSEEKFHTFCAEISKPGLFTAQDSLSEWGHPTKTIDGRFRTEGCSWLQDKALWEKYGPMPDYVMSNGITGDVWLNRKYQDSGVVDLLTGEAITYHLVRGESRNE